MTCSFQHKYTDTFSYAGLFTTLTVDGVPATDLTGFTVSATIKTYPERAAVDTLTVTTGPGLAVLFVGDSSGWPIRRLCIDTQIQFPSGAVRSVQPIVFDCVRDLRE